MKKEEFLNELESRIHILNESEKKDVIEEYAQHIDIKIENGLSEEDAVNDFGDIKELADEILSAYSVDLKYNRPDNIEKYKGIFKDFGNKAKELLNKSNNAIGKMLKKVGEKGMKLINGINAMFKKLFGKLKIITAKKDRNENTYDRKNEVIKEVGEKNKSFLISIKSYTAKIYKIIKRLFILAVKASVLVCLCPVAFVSAFAIMFFGFLIMLIFQGYPVVGVTIATLGLSMSLGVIIYVGLMVVKSKI